MTSPDIVETEEQASSVQKGKENVELPLTDTVPATELDTQTIDQQFGLDIESIYRLGIRFFRDQEGKAFHLSYDDRINLVAYTKLVAHGPYSEKADKGELGAGYFDFIGNDRLTAWENLGSLSREEAMAGFSTLLDQVCPPFRLYIEANKRDIEEKKMLQRLEEEKSRLKEDEEKRRTELEAEAKELAEEQLKRQELHKKQIKEALNKQTYHQFRAYAEQQVPGNPEMQSSLIEQLQEQHFQQYMQQVYAQHMLNQSAPSDPTTSATNGLANGNGEVSLNGTTGARPGTHRSENSSIPPASMWTRKDIGDFKEAIKKEGTDGIIKVGNGETVTVRVPTHEEGTCLFWEFASENYDLGFGVYFEWTAPESNTVSVHVSESSEEDDEEMAAQNCDEKISGGSSGVDASPGDVEQGSAAKDSVKPAQDEIIPVYRRDCHEEVYAGSHVYPGQGVYLLKFDNSYSLWRSKTLYYRVYYSR